MDDPKARLTNLHQLEGILFVQWAAYSPVSSSNSEAGQENPANTLASAEADLRKDGHYAFSDSPPGYLWHFVLSGPEAARDPALSQKTEQSAAIFARHCIKKVSSGSLRAADVAEALGSMGAMQGLEAQDGSKDANRAAFQANTMLAPGRSHDIRPGSPNPTQSSAENIRIYHKVMESLSRSLRYAVSQTGIWYPVSSDMFAPSARKLLMEAPPEEDLEYAKIDWSHCCKLEVTWLTSGTVVIKSKTVPLPGSPNIYVDGELVDDTDLIVMVPLGIIGHTVDEIDQADISPAHQREESEWKGAVMQWLTDQGLQLQSAHEWTYVRTILTDELVSQGKQSGATTSFLWPAELCHDVPPSIAKQNGDEQVLVSPEPIRDMLAEAEAWYINRDRRAEEVRIQLLKKKEEEEAEKEASDVDDYIHIFPKNDGMLDVQTMTGIYPTPPDAPRPSGSGPADDRTEQRGASYDAKTPATEGKTPKVTFEDAAEPERTSLELDSFDHIEEDDLFGNMQSNEYNNNGVTEDDFSFFDEPGDTPYNADTQPSMVMSPEDNRTQLSSSQTHEHLQISEKTERLAIDDDQSSKSPVSYPSVKTESTSHQGSDPQQMDWQHTPRDKDFPPTPVESKAPTFEAKYGKKGKFSTEVSGPQTTKPGHAPGIHNTIPSLSRPSDLDDSESDTDDSDSSIEPNVRIPGIEVEESFGRDAAQDRGLDQAHDEDYEDSLKEIESFYDSFSLQYKNFLGALNRSPYTLMQLQDSGVHLKPTPTNLDLHVRLAQIFADQMIYYKEVTDLDPSPPLNISYPRQEWGDPVGAAIRTLYPRGGRCTLEKLVHIGDDGTSTSSASKVPNRQPLKRADTMKGESQFQPISPVHPPQVRMKRGDQQMEINWVALRFWEDLGLSPFAGPKTVVAFCIFPDQEVVRRGARSFLTMMDSTYISLRLGSHDAGHAAMKGYRDGLVPMPKSDDDNKESSLERMCEKFGRSLQSLASQPATIVLYMFNGWDKAVGTKHLCNCFLKLFESYAGNLRFASNPTDIVLKVLPLSWIASSKTVAMPQVRDLVKLSKEIYDRCPLDDESLSPYASHSLIEISEPVPKSLDFKLTPETHVNPFYRETYAHVAYCWDQDSMWITAALTDTLGCHSWSASFYIGTADKWAVFRVFVKEILEIVEESIEDAHGRTRTVIYKDEPMSPEEQDCWTTLAQDESLILLSLDPSPSLHLLEEPRTPPTFDPTQLPSTIPTTPDVPSVDPNTTKPGDDFDPSARAVDLDEEAWAVVPIRSPDIERNAEARAMIAHGYLFKRNHAVFSLRVLHSEREVDVRELLAVNQGLVCIAKGRGLEGEVPCHVAVARRAQDGLVFF